MENGSLVEPTMIRPGGPDLNSSLIDMPELNQRSNNLSVYHRERSRIVEPSKSQRDFVQAANNQILFDGFSAHPYQEAPTRTQAYRSTPSVDDFQLAEKFKLQSNELESLRQRIKQVELENERLRSAARPSNQTVSSEAYFRLQKELDAERNQKRSELYELQSLRREVDSLKYANSKLEGEKQAYLKALGDLKKQRDQTGVQRMQVIAIRNFLVSVELERIRLMYLEKDRELETVKVATQ